MTTPSPASFQRIHTRRVFEEICGQIRERIAAGVLNPGDKLPPEREMAAGFQVSRPAVREALRSLENAGVVQLVKGVKGGAYIREASPVMLTQSLQDLMTLGSMSLADLAEARLVITEQVLKLACERRTEDDLLAIEETLHVLDTSEDMGERAEAGARFFTLVARCTHNRALELLVDSLTDIVRHGMDGSAPRSRPELQPVRRRLLAALRSRRLPGALEAMREYLALVHGKVLATQAVAAAPRHRRPPVSARPALRRAASRAG